MFKRFHFLIKKEEHKDSNLGRNKTGRKPFISMICVECTGSLLGFSERCLSEQAG